MGKGDMSARELHEHLHSVLEEAGVRFRCTPFGWVLSDAAVVELMSLGAELVEEESESEELGQSEPLQGEWC